MTHLTGYQVMPRLSQEEYADLEADIVAHGVQVPITVSEDGTIVDGHHRDEIARKHDLHCPRITARGSEAELRGLAFSLNLNRRHLNREQRRQLIAESLRSDPELSNVEHARRTGTSDKTVNAVREDMVGRSEIPSVNKRRDTRGRQQPASQPERPRSTVMLQDDLDQLNAEPEPEPQKPPTPRPPVDTPPTPDSVPWPVPPEQEQKDREESWKRGANRLEAFLFGFDQAQNMRDNGERDEILNLLTPYKKKLFLKIEEETTWPSTTPSMSI